MEDEGGNGQQLLGAAKNLACAVSEMLKTAQPASAEVLPEDKHGIENVANSWCGSFICVSVVEL